jgi:alanine-synthesizing transaminase
MEFRRIERLPPYVFSVVQELKAEARHAGEDIIDLGMGNPDLPSPEPVVAKLVEAAQNPRNHRYSMSRGLPKLRKAITDYYERRFDVVLDPETEAVVTMGAKEGFSHLMWTLVGPNDSALVPSPTYPIHTIGVLFAGAQLRAVPLAPDSGDFFEALQDAYERTWPRPRLVVTSFPHNPTTVCVDISFFERLVEFAKRNELFVVHDFAYGDFCFDDYKAPSLLQVDGARDVGVELYSMTKSFSMAGWRIAFALGNKEMIGALTKIKSYLDYGVFQPVQIATIIALNECSEEPKRIQQIHQGRRDVLISGLENAGWHVPAPKATMFVWAKIPEAFESLGSLEFSKYMLKEAKVAVSPGVGFGPEGEGFIRFALIENEHRLRQATRGIKQALAKGSDHAREVLAQ